MARAGASKSLDKATAPAPAKAVASTPQPVAKAEPRSPADQPKKPAPPPRLKQREVARAEEQAMKRVTTAIRESVELGPTLVVWLIDATPSAHDACPAAVTGIMPIRVAGDDPRSGSRVNNANVRSAGTNTSSTL